MLEVILFMKIPDNLDELKAWLSKHQKILSKPPDADLEDIGGIEETHSPPTEDIGGIGDLLNLPSEDIGGFGDVFKLPIEISGFYEPNRNLLGYTQPMPKPQPPMLLSAKPVQSIPDKNVIGKAFESNGKRGDKPLPMAELSKVIFQRMPFVSYKKMLYYYDDGIFKPCLQADFLELLWKILSKDELAKYNLLNFRNAYTFITSNPDIKIDDFPVHENCAVCNDYMVNIANGEYRKISHNDLVTSKINADYIPQSNLYTPMFDDFLSCVSNGDKQLERLICEVIGWCCTLPNHSKKVFFVLGYAPDSGKSVIGNFLKMLYGEDLVSHVPIGDMGTRFGTSPIIGKAINISMDLPSSTLNSMAVSAVKMLTGGDGISIDIKYMSQIQYKQPIHLLFASNHPIKLAEYDDAFYNRMVFVPFNNSVSHEQQDHELLKKLWQERDGIVTKCLFAVQDMLYEGRSFSCEPYNPDEYCNDTFDSDSIRDYVNENIIISRDKADELSTSDMYTDYRNWCDSNDLMPEAQCKFSTYVSKIYGINKRKKHTSESNVWVFVGVRYKTL